MTTSTAVHSNAFNFMSYLQNHVDARTGQYTCAVALPELKANNLAGPVVPVQLSFTPLNNVDSGFGTGWNLQLSQFDTVSGILSLHTGETFKVAFDRDGNAVIVEKKIDSFHFSRQDQYTYRVEHKSGLVETLGVVQGETALPLEMFAPQGHRVTLEYTTFNNTLPLLSHVRNADGSVLLSLERHPAMLELKLHPGSRVEARYVLDIVGGLTTRIELPSDDKGSWRFQYITLEGLTCLQRVETPAGGLETVSYASRAHSFPAPLTRKLPRVASHVRVPGFGQPPVETRYEYDDSDNNFLGCNSGLTWAYDGLDNLYKVTRDYSYETTEILVDGEQVLRSTRREFNRFHLLTLEEVAQPALDVSKGDSLQITRTRYHLKDNLHFDDQPAYCQLPDTVTQQWYYSKVVSPRHEETVSTTYDAFGNLLTQINANGVRETNEWYGAQPVGDYPGDPQGFVRHLKSKTVAPANAGHGSASPLTTRYRYSQQPGLMGASPWLAIAQEVLLEVVAGQEQELQRSTFTYINAPDNALEHGRKLKDVVSLNGLSTTTDYTYATARFIARSPSNIHAGEAVLTSVNSLTGFDGTQKVITLQHSLFTGEPLLNRDDNDVEIAYEYDLLGRVLKETVAPSTDYEASRTYTYTLASTDGQQASQSAIDVKGVETISLLDGFNRVVSELRRDADALGGNDQAIRETYRASYNQREEQVSETQIDWEGARDVLLTSHFNYDDWGAQRSVIRPDGVEEHEVTDPIARTTTQWVEGMGKTVTTLNLFDKPVNIKRLDRDDTLFSEHVYYYDGLGRTAEEVDAVGNETRYGYDAFGRMVWTELPDYSVVEREYAGHSGEDLPVRISVGGMVLGEQVFDGLERMIESITGGRKSVYAFDAGQRQPKSVLRPTGERTEYVYRPELGEDPEQRTATGSQAHYEYDPQSARLMTTREEDEEGYTHELHREYFTTGELKSEQRCKVDKHTQRAATQDTFEMHYDYSRQARLMSYTDVLGQKQTYEYDTYARLKKTTLGTTSSTFSYDALGQLKCIDTVDGTQRLQTGLEYDDFGREIRRTFDLGQGGTQSLEQTYDGVDRLTRRLLMQGGECLRDETYEYDRRGRLVYYTCEGSQLPMDPYGKFIEQQQFEFDELDNLRMVLTVFAGGENYSDYAYNNEDPCQLSAISNSHADYPATLEFTYDADGNLLLDEAGRQLSYDSLGRLSSVSAGSKSLLLAADVSQGRVEHVA